VKTTRFLWLSIWQFRRWKKCPVENAIDIADEFSRDTLRGLPGVGVHIATNVDRLSELKQAGLTRQQFQEDVELRLRLAGIRILREEELTVFGQTPALVVTVNVVQGSPAAYAYGIRVAVLQLCLLSKNMPGLTIDKDTGRLGLTFRMESRAVVDPVELSSTDLLQEMKRISQERPVPLSTWEVGAVGIASHLQLLTIREGLRTFVDRFINAYLSVNPRSTSGNMQPSQPFVSPRRDLVRQVQERLKAVGGNPGPIDGTLGSQTREALRWYQNTKGLPRTGEIDERTFDALGVGLVYSFIGHRIGYSHSEEVSICIHKRFQ
jgi:hypothetical protein